MGLGCGGITAGAVVTTNGGGVGGFCMGAGVRGITLLGFTIIEVGSMSRDVPPTPEHPLLQALNHMVMSEPGECRGVTLENSKPLPVETGTN
jgi:hypothetical protein